MLAERRNSPSSGLPSTSKRTVCVSNEKQQLLALTIYAGESADFMRTPLEELAQQIAAGTLHVQVARVFQLDEIADAHRLMEENRAGGNGKERARSVTVEARASATNGSCLTSVAHSPA